MQLFKNLSFYLWVVRRLIKINKIGKAIDASRKNGDIASEKEHILEAENVFAPAAAKRFGADIRIFGEENIPENAVLFASNHQGYGDIFVFMAVLTGKQIGFVAKESLFKIPAFGKWIARVRSVPILQGDPRTAVKSFRVGEEYLREGFSLVIFPEGTRSLSDNMASFKKGSMHLALKTGTPVVPVTIRGTWHLYEEKGYVRPGKVNIAFHAPIETKNLTREERAALPERVEQIVRKTLDEWNKDDPL